MSSSDFNTPPWLLDIVRRLSPIRTIGLDPCSNATSKVEAVTAYTKRENGLLHPWYGHGLTFMNPPHSMSPNHIDPWMEKACEDFITLSVHRDRRDQFVGLVPSKTGPEWFHEYAVGFDKCFLKGRIKFWENGAESEGAGKFDSLILYKGFQPMLFRNIFLPYGWCP